MFGKLKIGSEVWSTKRGKGKIKKILKKERILLVEFNGGICDTYTFDGKNHELDKEQELFL